MTGVPRLLLLTDRHQLPPGRDLVTQVAACLEAGARQVVLRELDLPEEVRADLAAALAGLGATVIAAHRLLPGAAGLHLPAGTADPAPSIALLGRSCHTPAEVAAATDADYVTLGPLAATASKPGYRPTLSPAHWRAAADAGPPVLAHGGITPETAPTALGYGVHGLAVMGAAMRARDPTAVLAPLQHLLDQTRPTHHHQGEIA